MSTYSPGASLVRTGSSEWQSWLFTSVGVLCFSFTFPMTRLSLRTFDPIIIALVRGAGAGIAALAYLVLSKSRLPNRRQVARLWSAAIGMVVIFPIFASIALRYVPSTHASVLASVLPLATAVFFWSSPRARIGFARILDICNSGNGSNRSILRVSIGVSFDRASRCFVIDSVCRLCLRVR